jgi:RHS repeat-associated protein
MVNQDLAKAWIGLLKSAVVIALLVAAPLLQAHDFGGQSDGGPPSPPPPNPPCNSCPCDGPPDSGGPGNSNGGPPGRKGKPVSLFNGAEEMSVTDLVVQDVMPIVIARKYDSRSSYDSPLGYGWAFFHDRRLYEYTDNSVVVRHGCGTRDRYVQSGGAYVTPVGSMLAKLTSQPDGSYQLSYLNRGVDTFDSQGRLLSWRDARGNRHEYTYDSRGKLPLVGSSNESIAPTQPMLVAHNYRLTRIDVRAADGVLTGRFVTFQYDESTGRLVSVTADDGRSVTYEHDVSGSLTRGNLTQVNGLGGVVATYAYADPLDPHNLTSITPAAGRTPIVNTYDAQDRVVLQVEDTRRMEIAYPVPYTRTTVTNTIRDHNGLNPYTAVTTYEFDTSGRVTKVVDALGHENRYTYNTAKMLARKEVWQKTGSTLALLQAIDWSYDANGNKRTESVTLDSGETITRSWTYEQDWIASEQVVSSAEPVKIFRNEYTFYYGADGRPTNIQSQKRRKDDGTFQTTSYTYNAQGRLLSTILPDGVEVVNEYTGHALTRTYYRVGGVAIPQMERRFEYDARGNRTKIWDARDHLTTYEYDDRDRVTRIINPLGEQTLYTYVEDRLTQLEVGRTAAGEGQITVFIHDGRDRLVGVQRKNDAGVLVTHRTYELDSEGRQLGNVDAEGRRTALAYDLLGRVATRTDALGKQTRYSYDAAGNRVSVIDALNRETKYELDDLNRVTAMVEVGRRSEHVYDAAGNLLSVTDPAGHTTSYRYDALSRTTRLTQQLGQFVEYSYDDRDRVDVMFDPRGSRKEFDYEPWGPLSIERRYPTVAAVTPARTIDYSHDEDGNLTALADDAVQSGVMWQATYDALGRRYDETVHYLPGGPRVLRHRYDRFGNRGELTLVDAATTANTYSYDKLNQLTSATLAGASLSLAYFDNDDLQSVTLPNGVTETFTYRPNGPVQTITVNGPGGQLEQFAYTYDDVLNVDTQSDALGLHDYGYDDLNRLTQVSRPASAGLPNESYQYDPAGNREDPGNAALYAYDDNNRITAGAGLNYTFDAAGNVASRSDGAAFTHDEDNRLVQFQRGSTNATYLYDAFGRRIRKTVNGTTTWFLWDAVQLIAEHDSNGARNKWYGYVPGDYLPRQILDAGGTSYLHADHLQTPRFATGATAQVVWRAKFEAFGKALVDADPDGDAVPTIMNFRFPGQYYDEESGLHYNYNRDYDPSTGRYVQSDPIGIEGGLNTYLYARNSPQTAIDPSGLFSLGVSETWEDVSTFPKGADPRSLGLTHGSIKNVKCSCAPSGCEWKLSGCSALLHIEVMIADDIWGPKNRFARDAERQHVKDLQAGVAAIRKAGEEAEAAMKEQTFSSQSACESAATAKVRAALWAETNRIARESGETYDHGRHTWRWPYWLSY